MSVSIHAPTRGATASAPPSTKTEMVSIHARGEDRISAAWPDGWLETPPRAWGRRLDLTAVVASLRNTPTRVGKTSFLSAISLSLRKHPHARGEDGQPIYASEIDPETPPRAWGRLKRSKKNIVNIRNTPTRVGKTHTNNHTALSAWKHPHARGEDTSKYWRLEK